MHWNAIFGISKTTATLYLFEDFSFFQLTVLVLNDAGLMQKKVIKMMFKKSHEFTFFVLKKTENFHKYRS